MPKIVATLLALYSAFLIETSLSKLPARIPVHFNAAGQPNGWGSQHTLWVLLGIQVFVAGVMLSMSLWSSRFPGALNPGTRRLSDFTPEQQERVWPLLDEMAGWMSVVTSFFFVFIIRESIQVTESSRPEFHAGWVAILFVIGMVGLAFYYLRRINKTVESPDA